MHLLSLICDPDRDPGISHWHSRRCFFGTDGTGFVLVLHERNSLPSRNQAHFSEPFETAEDGRERLRIDVVGQISDEKDLVRREILVWDDSRRGRTGGFEASPARSFRWSAAVSLLSSSWSFEFLLCLEGFLCLSSLCSINELASVPDSYDLSASNATGLNEPFSANRRRLCASNSSGPSWCRTAASLRVFA